MMNLLSFILGTIIIFLLLKLLTFIILLELHEKYILIPKDEKELEEFLNKLESEIE